MVIQVIAILHCHIVYVWSYCVLLESLVGDMAASDNSLTSPALPSHTFLSRVQLRTLGVGQPKTRKGQDKDEVEDIVTFYLK